MPPARLPLTRERITAAGREHAESVGLHGLSLRQVARSLGVTAAALYKHVGSKRELVELVAADCFAELAERITAIEATDPLERIRAQSVTYLEYALEHPKLYRVMMRFPPAMGAERGPGPVSFEPATQVFEASLHAVVEAVDAGRIAPVDPVVAGLTLWASVHGLVDVLLMGLELPEPVEAALISSSIDAVLAGLARPG